MFISKAETEQKQESKPEVKEGVKDEVKTEESAITPSVEIKVEPPAPAEPEKRSSAEDAGNQAKEEVKELTGSPDYKSSDSGIGVEEEEDYQSYMSRLFGTKIRLNMGRPPKPEEIAPDDEVDIS